MKALLGILAAGVVITVGWVIYTASAAPPTTEIVSNSPNLLDVPRHPVTEGMLLGSEKLAGTTIGNYEMKTDAGDTVRLADLYQERPVLILGIKDGCPCNLEAQHYYNDLYNQYGKKIAFVGLFDSDEPTAKLYKESMSMEFPMLLNPERTEVFEALNMEQSVYTTLVGKDGTVIRQWPGYSKAMLNELNDDLHELASQPLAVLDLEMAPEEPTSGCYFYRPVGWEPESKE